jgi:hypothetical protein
MDTVLPDKEAEIAVEKTVDGWTPAEIAYHLKKNHDSSVRESTITEFLEQDEIQKQIELEKSVQEKRAEVSRDELLRDLREQKEILHEHSRSLRERDEDEISNDTVSNLIKAIRTMAEMIDTLESKEEGGADNVININSLEQNFDITSTVEYLPPEDKRSIVEQLEDDPDVEDFAIVRKDEDDEEDKAFEREERTVEQ